MDVKLKCLLFGKVYSVKSSPFKIGRYPGAGLNIADVSVSRNHCQIKKEEMEIILYDTSSSGTYVNDEKIEKGNSRKLKNGDKIQFGSYAAQFEVLISGNEAADPADWEQHSQIIATVCKKSERLRNSLSNQTKRSNTDDETSRSSKRKKTSTDGDQQDDDLIVEAEFIKTPPVIYDANAEESMRELKDVLETESQACEKRLQEAESQAKNAASTKMQREMKQRLKELEEEKTKLSSELEIMKKRADEVAAQKTEEDAQARREMELKVSKMQLRELEAKSNLEAEKKKKEEAEAKLQDMMAAAAEAAASTSTAAASSPVVKVQALEDAIENEFQCPICAELFIEPVTLNCSHAFCSFCMDQWRANNTNCPSCRSHVTSCNRTRVMDNFIERIADSLSADFKNRRTEMIADRKKAQEELANKNRRASAPRGRGRGRGGRRNARSNAAVPQPTVTLSPAVRLQQVNMPSTSRNTATRGRPGRPRTTIPHPFAHPQTPPPQRPSEIIDLRESESDSDITMEDVQRHLLNFMAIDSDSDIELMAALAYAL